VGWQQETPGLLNIGLDRNDTLVRYNRWFNTQGIWEESSIAGSWMIRPVLGGPFRYPASIAPANTRMPNKCYPNPWNPQQEPLIFQSLSQPLRITMFQTSGQPIAGSTEAMDSINEPDGVHRWAFRPNRIPTSGLYLMEVLTQDGHLHRFKILVP
jgi:hypothetical protein